MRYKQQTWPQGTPFPTTVTVDATAASKLADVVDSLITNMRRGPLTKEVRVFVADLELAVDNVQRAIDRATVELLREEMGNE